MLMHAWDSLALPWPGQHPSSTELSKIHWGKAPSTCQITGGGPALVREERSLGSHLRQYFCDSLVLEPLSPVLELQALRAQNVSPPYLEVKWTCVFFLLLCSSQFRKFTTQWSFCPSSLLPMLTLTSMTETLPRGLVWCVSDLPAYNCGVGFNI